MNKHIITLIFLSVISSTIIAQKRLYKGYYVENKGDTVSCFIKRITSDINPSAIEISLDSSLSNLQRIEVSDIKEFAIYNGDIYKKYTAFVSTAFTDFTNMGFNPKIEKQSKTVMFRVQPISAALSFLTYKDKIKERYFLLNSSDSIPEELEYHVFKSSGKNPEIVKVTNYKIQLRSLVIKSGYDDTLKLRERLRYLDYEESSIVRFLNHFLNGAEGKTSATSSYGISNKTKGRFFFSGGINLYKYKEPSEDQYLVNGQRLHYTLSVSAGHDLVIDKEKNNLFLRFEVTVMPTSFKENYSQRVLSQFVTYKRSIFNLFLLAGPSVHFNIYNAEKTKVFAGAGIGYSSSYSVVKNNNTNTFFFNEPVDKRITGDFYIPLSIDAFVSDKLFVSAGYTFLDIQNPYRLQVFSAKMGYLLTRKKR